MHPEHGEIAPEEFIPLAESIGLIKPLTAWVLDAALRQLRAWDDSGLAISVAINLSTWNLQDPTLVETVKRSLQRWRVASSRLRLEITESALIHDPARAMTRLMNLHDLGVRISIDDFGTGYSSLAYLRKLPVDEIKIDRSFVMDMTDAGTNPRSSSAVSWIWGTIWDCRSWPRESKPPGRSTCSPVWAAIGPRVTSVSRPLPASEYPRWLAEWEAFQRQARAV